MSSANMMATSNGPFQGHTIIARRALLNKSYNAPPTEFKRSFEATGKNRKMADHQRLAQTIEAMPMDKAKRRAVAPALKRVSAAPEMPQAKRQKFNFLGTAVNSLPVKAALSTVSTKSPDSSKDKSKSPQSSKDTLKATQPAKAKRKSASPPFPNAKRLREEAEKKQMMALKRQLQARRANDLGAKHVSNDDGGIKLKIFGLTKGGRLIKTELIDDKADNKENVVPKPTPLSLTIANDDIVAKVMNTNYTKENVVPKPTPLSLTIANDDIVAKVMNTNYTKDLYKSKKSDSIEQIIAKANKENKLHNVAVPAQFRPAPKLASPAQVKHVPKFVAPAQVRPAPAQVRPRPAPDQAKPAAPVQVRPVESAEAKTEQRRIQVNNEFERIAMEAKINVFQSINISGVIPEPRRVEKIINANQMNNFMAKTIKTENVLIMNINSLRSSNDCMNYMREDGLRANIEGKTRIIWPQFQNGVMWSVLVADLNAKTIKFYDQIRRQDRAGLRLAQQWLSKCAGVEDAMNFKMSYIGPQGNKFRRSSEDSALYVFDVLKALFAGRHSQQACEYTCGYKRDSYGKYKALCYFNMY